ncbi:hypothetical protein L0F63_006883 [Massospora cicadina]|nr:hypothetical protein L0F63_006883 [Massospora cicadina]
MSVDDKILTKEVSQRDLSVLGQIFEDFGGAEKEFETQNGQKELSGSKVCEASEAYKSIDAELLSNLKVLELEAVRLAEEGASSTDADASLYSEAISKFSEVISLCPEYASAWNNRAQAYRMAGDVEKALADLEKAIHYGHFANDSRTLGQAYTQRAETETAASDLENGAKYGNTIAKKLAVAQNPYAKMCSAMVKEMLTRLE